VASVFLFQSSSIYFVKVAHLCKFDSTFILVKICQNTKYDSIFFQKYNKLNGDDYNEIKNKINERFNLGVERRVLDLEVMSLSSG